MLGRFTSLNDLTSNRRWHSPFSAHASHWDLQIASTLCLKLIDNPKPAPRTHAMHSCKLHPQISRQQHINLQICTHEQLDLTLKPPRSKPPSDTSTTATTYYDNNNSCFYFFFFGERRFRVGGKQPKTSSIGTTQWPTQRRKNPRNLQKCKSTVSLGTYRNAMQWGNLGQELGAGCTLESLQELHRWSGELRSEELRGGLDLSCGRWCGMRGLGGEKWPDIAIWHGICAGPFPIPLVGSYFPWLIIKEWMNEW